MLEADLKPALVKIQMPTPRVPLGSAVNADRRERAVVVLRAVVSTCPREDGSRLLALSLVEMNSQCKKVPEVRNIQPPPTVGAADVMR